MAIQLKSMVLIATLLLCTFSTCTHGQDVASQLAALLTMIDEIQKQQTQMAAAITQLKDTVDRANQLAEARANDNRLIDLIQAGRQDVAWYAAHSQAKVDQV
eukprot:CAMPEP_0202870142 /NCGR_PEP_ID=MMETSP1391-20130828/14739_1 /ASSEMBLY_ACC=CAM_ASM_000867 /TAXON_ID=1034604 /ORGANISM="Chlamydomonas leiostraca, Strain SAG 11-49" /LENGTH=101 /DNA_ID=CAMNT_0049550625 /DNA_START=19 /DNA_END=320 /DNA_ORIENTATION=+